MDCLKQLSANFSISEYLVYNNLNNTKTVNKSRTRLTHPPSSCSNSASTVSSFSGFFWWLP